MITITIAGRAVNDTIEWQPGFQQPVSLIAGPAFGNYYGALQIDGIPPPFKVLPYVDGTVCGEDLSTMAIAGTKRAYHVVVDPDELRPGCGRAGVDVTLRLKIAGQPDIVLDTVRWETGAALQRPSVDLSGRIPTTPLATTTASQ